MSWLPYLFGASVGWCTKSFDQQKLIPVLSRDVFRDPTGRVAKAALALGLAHRKFGYKETNQTPYGTVIAAPDFGTREMICRNGAKCYARIPAKKIRAALAEVERQIVVLESSGRRYAVPPNERILVRELELAARMAAESCRIMLWQQALAAGKTTVAQQLVSAGIKRLQELECEFKAFWAKRNKATTKHCSPWLRWRMQDYESGRLHFTPEQSRVF